MELIPNFIGKKLITLNDLMKKPLMKIRVMRKSDLVYNKKKYEKKGQFEIKT